MLDSTPVAAVLSWTWIALTIEIDNAVEVAGADHVGRNVRISLPMWTNGLRHIGDDGVTVDELRVSARATCNLGGLERWGWITVGDTAVKRRPGYGTHRGITGGSLVRPTRAGRYARRVWPRAVEAVEDRWRTRFGGAAIDALRETLLAQPAAVRAMPWSPPEVNPTDGFRTHVEQSTLGSADEDVPLVAALGQALVSVTLEHELSAEVSLPLAANLLRVVDGDTVRRRDLPARSGISKEAVAMADSYLNRSGLATTADNSVVLTAAGLDALDGYHHRSAQTSDPRLHAALSAVLDQTPALTAGLVAPPGCWRAENPYLAQTRRLLDDPTGSLPWQPMVLHRGGWPDGS